MKKLICALAVICIACICAAEVSDSHRDAAKELYIIKSPRDVFIKNFMIVFKTQLAQMSKMGIDTAKITKIEKEAVVLAGKVVDDPEMEQKMTAIYAEAFTENELKEMIAFYKTPTGKKALVKTPELLQKTTRVAQELTLKLQAGFQKQVKAILAGEDE